MLFARTCLRDQIEEDMLRNYSWWAESHSPGFGLTREPRYRSFEHYAETLPENEEDFPKGEHFVPPGEWRLPGLCAVCAATSYQELARKILKDRENPDGWIGGRMPVIAILDGQLIGAGADPAGWPVFRAERLVAIAEIDAIRNPEIRE
jgi:hypothetical protein